MADYRLMIVECGANSHFGTSLRIFVDTSHRFLARQRDNCANGSASEVNIPERLGNLLPDQAGDRKVAAEIGGILEICTGLPVLGYRSRPEVSSNSRNPDEGSRVSDSNSNGVSRQKVIRDLCHSGDALVLIREPENPFDANAIQIRRIVCLKSEEPASGEQLGYVSRELATDLAQHMDEGAVCFAEITGITGNLMGQDAGNVGVNIRIEEYQRIIDPRNVAPTRRNRKRPTGNAKMPHVQQSLPLVFPLTGLILAGCSVQPPPSHQQQLDSFERTLAEYALIREQVKCLHRPLTPAQENYLKSVGPATAQQYLSLLIQDSECEASATRWCETNHPGKCIALSDGE